MQISSTIAIAIWLTAVLLDIFTFNGSKTQATELVL
jgi:hypothetical protein